MATQARDAVIFGTERTPIGRRNGQLADVHAVELSATVLDAVVTRTGIDPKVVDDVAWGRVGQVGEQTGDIGRERHGVKQFSARLMATMVHRMRRNGIRYGLQTMCEGGGLANATIVELL